MLWQWRELGEDRYYDSHCIWIDANTKYPNANLLVFIPFSCIYTVDTHNLTVLPSQAFLDFFGEVMTGVRSKAAFLQQPDLMRDIAVELLRQVWLQYVWGCSPLVPQDIGEKVVSRRATKK